MTNKQRVHAALEGRPVDRCPVTSLYCQLYHLDHFAEASMKGYVNDTAEIARRIGDRMALFSNIDPVGVLQNGTDALLEAEIRRQVQAGRHARGFILNTASPITPATPLARVRRFVELGRQIGSDDRQAVTKNST